MFESKKKKLRNTDTPPYLAGIWEVTQITLSCEIQAEFLRVSMPSRHSCFLPPQMHFSLCKKVNSHQLLGNVSEYSNPQIIHFHIITYMTAYVPPHESWTRPTRFEAKIQSGHLGLIAHRLILDILNVGWHL